MNEHTRTNDPSYTADPNLVRQPGDLDRDRDNAVVDKDRDDNRDPITGAPGSRHHGSGSGAP